MFTPPNFQAQQYAPPQAQPPAQQYAPPQAQPPAQQYAPPQAQPQPSMSPDRMAHLAQAIAGASLGTQRLGFLPLGQHLLQIDKCEMPERSTYLVVEFTVLQSTSAQPGERYKWMQDLAGGTKDKDTAQRNAALGFVLRAIGFDTREEAEAVGCTDGHVGQYIQACFVAPGPFVGKTIAASVSDSGRRTRDTQEVIGSVQFIAHKPTA